MRKRICCSHWDYRQCGFCSHKALENIVNRAVAAAGKYRVVTGGDRPACLLGGIRGRLRRKTGYFDSRVP